MHLGENLSYLRRQANLTQEELADRMGVSRQTVSKWEAGGAYPEMEKLLTLCDLFGVTMDTLLRGSAAEARAAETQDYDAHMNQFTRRIAAGVGLVLLGVTMLLLLCGLGLREELAVLVFFAFLIAAVSLLVLGGVTHGSYIRENPVVSFSYEEDVVRDFRRKFPILIVFPIALILFGVMALLAIYYILPEPHPEALDYFSGAAMLFCITMAVPILIYAGMQQDKYDVKKYNQENNPDVSSPEGLRKCRADRICSCIMLTATAAFLLLGFLGNLWHPGWVVFPVGGIACGIVNSIFGTNQD